MKHNESPRAKILALGSAFPEHVVTNADMEKIVDTSDAWIRERSGIQERRRIQPGQNNSDIATLAAKDALKKAGLLPTDLDLIINCTNTPDKLLPAMACIVQQKLGASPSTCAAFDVIGACAGWMLGMSIADQYIRTGMYKKILVLGAETLSRFVNWKDRGTCVLFGDGAGAAIVGVTEDSSKSLIYSTHMHSDGRYADILDMPGGGSELPPGTSMDDRTPYFLRMKGTEVFKQAVRSMADVAMETLEFNNMKIDDVDWFIPHQANIRIIEAVAKKLNFPAEKIATNVHKYGNTSSATIPTAFDEYVQKGKIKRGHNVLMSSFGGGLTWAGALVKY